MPCQENPRLYAESWPLVYFEPLIAELAAVGRDDAGRETLKSSVKKIVIQNTTGCYYGDRGASFEEGVLTLDHEPLTNTNAEDRKKGVVALLESKL